MTPRLVERDGVIVASTAVVLGDVRLARGVSIWYGAVIRGDMSSISIGGNTNIQDLCVLHTDPGLPMTIGASVTVGHMAVLHGSAIGDRCLIGMQCCLLAGSEIGEGCIVAAGSLVLENRKIPSRSIIAGVPARVVGEVTDAQFAALEDRANRYLETARRHVQGRISPEFMTEYTPGQKPPGW